MIKQEFVKDYYEKEDYQTLQGYAVVGLKS